MKASVVVPAFNAEKTLGACLDGLMQQRFSRSQYEVIVVDDGSTDRTPEIAQHYAVTVISQENQGPAAARNAGARTARGEIILFTDADCIPTADWIEQMLVPFREDEVAAVKGAYRTHQREIVARFAQIEFEERFHILERAGHTDMVDTYSAGFRQKVFSDFNGFDTRFPVANNEDTELSYRMAAANLKMVFNPAAIVFHLNHPDTVWRYARLKFDRGYWRMIVYRQFPDKMVRDTYTPKTLKIQIVALACLLLSLPFGLVSAEVGMRIVYGMLFLLVCSFCSFFLFALRKDVLVGFCSPALLTIRAGAVGLGACCGFVKGRL